jgi:Photosynthetic reaction centre cytochrome C subunit
MKRLLVLALLLVLPLIAQNPAPASGASNPAQGAPTSASTASPAAQAAPGANQEDPAEKRFKNVKVLTGVPQSQIIPTMELFRASLGVRCEFCHVAGNFVADDKKEKETARKMIQMVFDINKNNFAGRTQVTCNTCHHGQNNPVAIPVITAIADGERREAEAQAARSEPLLTAAQIVDKYIDALGGAAALQAVQSRVYHGTLQRMKIENPGTPQQKIVNRGESDPLEIDQKANKAVMLVTLPQGQMVNLYDGSTAWQISPQGKRPMNPAETARMAAQADLQRELKMRDRAARMRAFGKEQIGDHQAYVVGAQGEDGRRERLYFDAQTGLLLRRIVYTALPVGSSLEQTDYDDYRAVDGVKVPFTMKVTALDDDRNGTTRKFSDIKNNVPVDDAKFAAPTQ